MKVLKNYLYNATYQVFVLLVPLVTIPYISRVLGPQGVGINTLTNSTIQYFVLIANLGLTTYGQREIAYTRSREKNKLSEVFWEIETISLITTAISFFLFLITLHFINNYHIYYLAQSFLICASAFDVSWLFMGLENFKITVLRNFVFRVISIVLIFSLVKNHNDITVYILIISVSTVFSNLSLWPYLKEYISKVPIRKLHLKRHIRPTIELFIPQIAISVYGILNKVMLGHFSTVASSGYYDNSDKIIRICLALLTSFSTVMMPHVAQAFVRGENKKIQEFVRQGIDIAVAFSFPLSAGIIAVAPNFVPWFFGKNFDPVVNVISIEAIAIIPISLATILGAQYLVPSNKNNQYTISILCGALVNILINITLIHYFSAEGAAIATVVAETVVTFVQVKFTMKNIKLIGNVKESIKPLVSSLIMFFIIFTMTHYLAESFMCILFEIIIGVLVYTLFMITLRSRIIMNVFKVLQIKFMHNKI